MIQMKHLIAVYVFATLLVGTAVASDRPNIVFIFSDDHATQAIGAYDGWLKSVNPTPNIDKLAAEGVLLSLIHI